MAKPRHLIWVILVLLSSHNLDAKSEVDALRALRKISDARIPQKNNHCEINGASTTDSAGHFSYKPVSVSDFLTHFEKIQMAQKKDKALFTTIKCEGEKILDCEVVYGATGITWTGASTEEGDSTHLKFKLNSQTKSALKNSLECFQVP